MEVAEIRILVTVLPFKPLEIHLDNGESAQGYPHGNHRFQQTDYDDRCKW